MTTTATTTAAAITTSLMTPTATSFMTSLIQMRLRPVGFRP